LKKGNLTKSEAKERLSKYCAYQERSQYQVRNKLYELGLYGDEIEDIIADLINENFINEERFSKSYVRGKFRLKKWGRIKIKLGLKQHKISSYCIKSGFEEIDEQEYIDTLQSLLNSKLAALNDQNPFIKNQKAARYVIGKGFEPELVWDHLNI